MSAARSSPSRRAPLAAARSAELNSPPGRLGGWLISNSAQLEQVLLARAVEIEPRLGTDPECFVCILQAARAAVKLVGASLEQGESWQPQLLPPITALARLLARKDVERETLVRGAYAGAGAFLRFVCEEFSASPRAGVHCLFALGGHFEQLLDAFAGEYDAELHRLDRSPALLIAESVERLLAGEAIDAAALPYRLDGWHLGLIALGSGAELAARRLAERLGCRLLLVPHSAEATWIWLGAQRPLRFEALERLAGSGPVGSVSLAAGEPRQGVEGWRLTHREAEIAAGLLRRTPRPLLRCADVLLQAAVIADPEMRTFLDATYIAPISAERDAAVLRRTVRAYLSLGANAASAAASLGVARHTVERRLRRIERIFGRKLSACAAELDVALRVEELERSDSPGRG